MDVRVFLPIFRYTCGKRCVIPKFTTTGPSKAIYIPAVISNTIHLLPEANATGLFRLVAKYSSVRVPAELDRMSQDE